jgi:hypothetical protein
MPTEPKEWEEVLGAVARGWCHPENHEKVMDSDLAIAIAKELMPIVSEARRLAIQEAVGVLEGMKNDYSPDKEESFQRTVAIIDAIKALSSLSNKEGE